MRIRVNLIHVCICFRYLGRQLTRSSIMNREQSKSHPKIWRITLASQYLRPTDYMKKLRLVSSWASHGPQWVCTDKLPPPPPAMFFLFDNATFQYKITCASKMCLDNNEKWCYKVNFLCFRWFHIVHRIHIKANNWKECWWQTTARFNGTDGTSWWCDEGECRHRLHIF